MKKLLPYKLLGLILCLTSAALLSSCTRLSGNYNGYSCFYPVGADGGFYAFDYLISPNSLTYETASQPSLQPWKDGLPYPAAVEGGDAPRYTVVCAPGYEGILPHLNALKPTERSVFDCLAVYSSEEQKLLLGACNVYKRTVGYLSGGGNYGMEELECGYLFKYYAEDDVFEIVTSIKGGMISSFFAGGIVYWQRGNYYYTPVGTHLSPRLILEDFAFDRGIVNQSSGRVLFSDQCTLFIFSLANGTASTERVFIFRPTDERAVELKKTN